MKKSKKYAKRGALILAIGNGIWNYFEQIEQINKDPKKQFDFWAFLKSAGKGAAVGGLAGYSIGYYLDQKNAKIEPIRTDPILKEIVNKTRLDKNNSKYKQLAKSAQTICDKIHGEYHTMLRARPQFFGSSQKGTALAEDFDIDISLQFKPDSFSSTEQMFDDLSDFLDSLVGTSGITRVRLQKRSIGLFLNIGKEEYRLDIVPIKLTKRKKSGYLYVNDRTWLFDNSTIKKTNIDVLTKTRLTQVQKEIVVLVKKWRNENDLPLSSHLIENIVIRCYGEYKGRIPKGITAKFIMVVKYIRDNLICLRITGSENSNNVLTDFDPSDKHTIVKAADELVKKYQYQPNSILQVFQ